MDGGRLLDLIRREDAGDLEGDGEPLVHQGGPSLCLLLYQGVERLLRDGVGPEHRIRDRPACRPLVRGELLEGSAMCPEDGLNLLLLIRAQVECVQQPGASDEAAVATTAAAAGHAVSHRSRAGGDDQRERAGGEDRSRHCRISFVRECPVRLPSRGATRSARPAATSCRGSLLPLPSGNERAVRLTAYPVTES